jgi:outer membrane biosynthesis protein TonB
MGNLTYSLFLSAALLSTQAQSYAQNLPSTAQKGSSAHVQLDPKVAEGLLIHKEEPACQKDSVGLRIGGTVVIAITIDKNGNVSHPRTLSGPKILRPIALATVRKYRYKPYLLKQTPVEVETIVSIRMDCFFHNGQA